MMSLDKIIRITLGLFMIIFIIFLSVVSFQLYVEHTYRASLNSTYSYTCTITTSSTLSDVTFFIPVPADTRGNSPVVERFSTRDIGGLPYDWTVTLFDTGKATMVRITTPGIVTPPETSREKPFSISLSSELTSGTLIDTREPLANSALFRPARDVREVYCPPDNSSLPGTPLCYHYNTSLYADYRALPDTRVSLISSITGRNSWEIFEPGSNEYTSRISLEMVGAKHGWETVSGFLRNSTGRYDVPIISP
jgi:hypothetical protein